MQLSGKRRLTVRDFKGKKFLDIREFYEKDGSLLPGKKGARALFAWLLAWVDPAHTFHNFVGIMMPIDQLEALFSVKDAILDMMRA